MGSRVPRLRAAAANVVVTVLVGSLLVGGSASPVGAEGRTRCAADALRLRFWPKGTPENPMPHVDVYAGAHGHTRPRDRVAYADATVLKGAFICGEPSDFARRTKEMRRKVRTSSAVQIVCRPGRVRTFSTPSSLPVLSPQSFGQVQIRGTDRRVLYVNFAPNQLTPGGGPVLQYDSRVCARVRS